jgi:hypothetical protein
MDKLRLANLSRLEDRKVGFRPTAIWTMFFDGGGWPLGWLINGVHLSERFFGWRGRNSLILRRRGSAACACFGLTVHWNERFAEKRSLE